MGFSPINQGLTSPTPYPLESCPFHSTLHCRSWLWFILFDVRIYMMPHYNVPDSMTYCRQPSLLPKHTQPNRWWGFYLELLTTINYIIYIMQTGSKPGALQTLCKEASWSLLFTSFSSSLNMKISLSPFSILSRLIKSDIM